MTRHGRRATFAGVLLVVSLQWGCASNAPERPRGTTPSASSGTVVNPPRSDRGNPPFYDVLGKRYYVLPSSDGYRARGVASWYGRDFHGLATSSGETYNMHAMTAAHTTLPIPTWVEVTNLANGKHVIVKVNDRGPFVDNRLIDLSYAAALQLDMVRNGTARVEVRALDAVSGAVPVTTAAAAGSPEATVVATALGPTSPSATVVPAGGSPTFAAAGAVLAPPIAVASAHPGAADAPAAAGEQLFVQVGAFSDRANAMRLVDRLRVNGFVNAFVVTDGDGRRALHRVRLGPLRGAQDFDQVRARLRSLGFGESQLVTAR